MSVMRRCQRPFALLLWSVFSLAWADTLLDNWQVMELRLNTPAVGGRWYGSTSPLNRSLNINSGYVSLYTIAVTPGLQYTVQLRAPGGLRRIRAYLYDRWPLLADARQFALPNGPVVLTPHVQRITYRWQVGISSQSTGNLLYVLVQYPRDPGRRPGSAPRIEVRSPPYLPAQTIGQGVTYLQGPRELVLRGNTAQEVSTMYPAESPDHDTEESHWTMPGDLISNGRFSAGLKDWVPFDTVVHRQDAPNVSAKGLRLTSNTGVRQQLDVDVAQARSLVLWADLRLDMAAGKRPVAGNGPYFEITVCYRDRQGSQHCGDRARRVEFYTGSKNTSVRHKSAGIAQYLPAGHWYHYQVDLLDMKPIPGHIDSIGLRSSSQAGTTWVRQVHLIIRSEEHATQ